MTSLSNQLRDLALGLERGDAFVMTTARRMREIADQVMRFESRRHADLSQKAHLMCANMPGTVADDDLPEHWQGRGRDV